MVHVTRFCGCKKSLGIFFFIGVFGMHLFLVNVKKLSDQADQRSQNSPLKGTKEYNFPTSKQNIFADAEYKLPKTQDNKRFNMRENKFLYMEEQNFSVTKESEREHASTGEDELPATVSVSTCLPKTGRLSVIHSGGLGNLMFQYASMYGIARRLGMIPTEPSGGELSPVFHITAEPNDNTDILQNTIKVEQLACVYDPTVYAIPCGSNITLCCYFQSWKYFQDVEAEIRSQFKFQPNVLKDADFYWTTVVLPVVKVRGPEVTFIAVHVRRGDKVSDPKFVANGNTVATAAYLMKGYDFFQSKYNNVLFVVCSDDLNWAREVLPKNISVFVDSHSREVDMAVLSRCNHTLMTVGTFGWWVSWLIGGTTVFYKHMFRPNSYLSSQFSESLDDWVFPGWIPMD